MCEEMKQVVKKYIEDSNGILKLRPAWVARDFLVGGHRLGLKEEDYDCGERGEIIERWFCSETHAVNTIDVPSEGFSELEIPGYHITVPEALSVCKEEILGEEYAKNHDGLGRLIKVYDYKTRLFFHIHQRQQDLNTQGKTSKDEAYHFLDAPLGDHPETFFGVHKYIVDQNLQYDIFMPMLENWNGDDVSMLKHSRAFQNVPGEGFYLDSGILHAPGTALTMEIQEPSDVGAIYQANINGYPVDKALLTKDVAPEDIEKWGSGELAALHQVDWEACADPEFYEKRRLYPKICDETRQGEIFEEWIYYGSSKFSGKRLILKPGQKFISKENGVYNMFIWKGQASVNGVAMIAGQFDMNSCDDELLIVDAKAREGVVIENTGDQDVVLYKYFGKDINPVTPEIG